MRKLGGEAIILATAAGLLALGACAAKGPKPSQAIVEARQRAKIADAQVKCVVLGEAIGAPFVYGEAAMSDDTRVRLDQAVAWAACTPRAQVAVTVDPEPHHRQPEKERDLLAARTAAVRGYLSERLPAGALLAEGATPDPARPLLTVRARGW